MTVATNRLVVICGATGSGKTTLVRSILEDDATDCVAVTKYSERPSRGPDDDVVHVDVVEPSEYDMAYEAMGNRYGLKFDEIKVALAAGRTPVLSLTDMRAVSRLKAHFGDDCLTVAVMSALDPSKFMEIHGQRYPYNPNAEDRLELGRSFNRLRSAARLGLWQDVYAGTRHMLALWEASLPERASLEIRTRKVRDFQTRFFENFGLFDHVILNYKEGEPEGMTLQLRNLLLAGSSQPRLRSTFPPVFVVSGASGSGKGMMAAALQVVAPNEVTVVSKQAKRDQKPQDKRDGMIAIGPDSEFSPEYDIPFVSHKASGFPGIQYAISSAEIQRGIEEGRPQLLVSNVLQNPKLLAELKNRFGDHIVTMYLFRFQSLEEMVDFQLANCSTDAEAQARIAGAENLYAAYQDHISLVDHVLLNTAYPEDLQAQMFRLIEMYRSPEPQFA